MPNICYVKDGGIKQKKMEKKTKEITQERIDSLMQKANDIFCIDDALKKISKRKYVYARFAIFNVLRKKDNLIITLISDIVEMNTATVIYGISQHEMLYKFDKNYQENYDKLYNHN